jgi:hypothetical protein
MGAPAVIKKVFSKPKPPPAPPTPAPTVAEVSQSAATDAYDVRREKKRGRSATIITGPTGVEEGLTLGKKSLLGS